jgi:predicted short-subunit dehydrogenase-like oxidoreductase (DUF2520 family)
MRELERDSLPPSTERSPLVIVGAGRAGRSLGRAAEAAGLEVAFAGRDDARRAAAGAVAVLLCVPDTAIPEAAASVASAGPPPELVGHVSGASTLEPLAAAARRGAETFSLHPLQTFPDGAASVEGTPCAVAGSTEEAQRYATRLAERLGMRPFEVPEERRAAYHAAAAIASNLLVALEESAAELLERAGVEDARELLAPLVLRTAANWAERGAEALTGPIARGDWETVAAHVDAIRADRPELVPLYETLAETTKALL